MTRNTDPTLTHVAERDIDLLVVEELKCSPTFRRWFYGRVFPSVIADALTIAGASTDVFHSVTRTCAGRGETDIHVKVRFDSGSGPKTFLLLIEDKIDSPFTPTQCERYQKAASEAKSSGAADGVACVLLCPSSYCEGTAGFDAKVTYEEMAEFFQCQARLASDELKLRYQHREDMVRHAIGRFRRGYESIPDPINSNFWREYYQLISQIAPELAMSDPGDKPTYSIDVYLKEALPRVSGLSKAWLLKHSLENGSVMIEISQWGPCIQLLQTVLQKSLEPDMVVKAAGKSIQIRLAVPALDTDFPFQQQIEPAKNGILAMKRLRDWYLAHANIVGECQRIAEPN